MLSISTSLVPRLPHFGTGMKSLIFFSHVSSIKSREGVAVHEDSEQGKKKRAKVAGNLLHVSSCRESNIIHIER